MSASLKRVLPTATEEPAGFLTSWIPFLVNLETWMMRWDAGSSSSSPLHFLFRRRVTIGTRVSWTVTVRLAGRKPHASSPMARQEALEESLLELDERTPAALRP